jgi:type 1 glutamine amidotransferase
MRKNILLLTFSLLFCGTIFGKQPTRVLVMTEGHAFDREKFFAMLESFPGVTFTEVKHPDALFMLQPEHRKSYDVILLYDMPQTIREEEKKNFIDCLNEGKGLVALHHTTGSYPEWPEFQEIIGGRYTFKPWTDAGGTVHPASDFKDDVPFRVHVADRKHPVNKGIEDFDVVDETYLNVAVNPDVHVLLTTDEPTSTPSLAWTKKYGKSKVVTFLMGHDDHAYSTPNFRKFLNQAIQWVK